MAQKYFSKVFGLSLTPRVTDEVCDAGDREEGEAAARGGGGVRGMEIEYLFPDFSLRVAQPGKSKRILSVRFGSSPEKKGSIRKDSGIRSAPVLYLFLFCCTLKKNDSKEKQFVLFSPFLLSFFYSSML